MRLLRFTDGRGPPRPGVAEPDRDVVVDLHAVGDELDVGLPYRTPALLATPRWREKAELLATHAAETGVGERARRIDPGEAAEHVAGYTVANDVSARDLQFADDQWVRGKSLDTFCPLGPELVTGDELGDPDDLALWTDLNGERLQESTTANLIFDVDRLVSFCSDAFTLNPGDVILTGTPPGVGAFREPPVYLGDGDEVTVGVEGIGELTNGCAHE
jgi:2-keto-4-pentenoate hydratase/2-oxohepta-3-ene-1,7-dioic acid hydratase in catechol pathway